MTDARAVYAQLWEAWLDGDLAAVERLCDGAWTPPAAGLAEAFGSAFEVRSVLSEIRSRSATEALGLVRASVTSRATGEEIEINFAEVVRTRDRRIVEVQPVFLGTDALGESLF